MSPLDTDAIAARLKNATPGPWGRMNDGPYMGTKPWTAYDEAAPGLTLASPANTEPICRVSGYCQPVEANADFIAAAPGDIAALLAEVATLQKNYQLLMESHQGMANENLRLGGIIQALREALQPFAALLNKAHRNRPDESPFYCVDDAEITVGDLRKAWAVSRLTEEPK